MITTNDIYNVSYFYEIKEKNIYISPELCKLYFLDN